MMKDLSIMNSSDEVWSILSPVFDTEGQQETQSLNFVNVCQEGIVGSRQSKMHIMYCFVFWNHFISFDLK